MAGLEANEGREFSEAYARIKKYLASETDSAWISGKC
jgi:hypothetical protein